MTRLLFNDDDGDDGDDADYATKDIRGTSLLHLYSFMMMTMNKRSKCHISVTLIRFNEDHGDECHDADNDTRGISVTYMRHSCFFKRW